MVLYQFWVNENILYHKNNLFQQFPWPSEPYTQYALAPVFNWNTWV